MDLEFKKIGKYDILGEIGQGAMGVVYKAHDPILNRFVAIKMISANLGADDELKRRFHREAQAAARLNHQNIITVFDFGEEQGKIYMAMELLEGTDLKDLMAAGALQTLDDKLAVVEQILDGLAFAHSKEVVHRDLKPGNIHIQPNGQVKIMDFGLARLGSSEMTQAGVVMGTPNYMSPEQVLGEKVDSRSDVFAMGAVFYEILTDHKPFEAESMHGVLFQVVHKEPQSVHQWVPDMPPVLVQVVEKCLAKEKDKRFQNAGEMREAIGTSRQALAAGRIQEATLDMETGRVFLDLEEFVDDGSGGADRGWQGQTQAGPRVDGTVALAPLESVLDSTATPQQPATLTGRSRTQVLRPGVPLGPAPTPPPPWRMPAMIAGAVVIVVGVVVGVTMLRRPTAPPTPSPGRMSTMLQVLVETRNELAQNALNDKNYKKAIDTVQQTLTMVKEENAPEDHRVVVASKKILDEARSKFDAIETTASDAENAYRANDLTTAAQKIQQLSELDSQHPVVKELSSKLNTQLRAQADDTRKAMAQAKEQADKISASAPAEYRAEGRTDLGKAEEAAAEAESSLRKGAYGPAMQKYAEARDAYERGRRAIETKLAEAAQKDAALRAQLKVPAEEALKTMRQVRAVAEQAGAPTNPAAREEFNNGVTLARDAEAAMGRQDYPAAKKAFDDARIAFDRSRQAIERASADKAAADRAAADKAVADKAAAEKAAADRAAAERAAAEKAAADRAAAEKAAADKAAAEKAAAAAATPAKPVAAPPPPPVGAITGRASNLTDLSTKKGDQAGFTGAGSPEFTGEMDFDPPTLEVAVGQPYVLKVFVKNTGPKAMKIKEIAATSRVNRQAGPPVPASLSVRDVAPGQRVQVGEVRGTWADGVDTFVLTVKVTNDKGDGCANNVAFRKKQ